jgi:hypothetical protein
MVGGSVNHASFRQPSELFEPGIEGSDTSSRSHGGVASVFVIRTPAAASAIARKIVLLLRKCAGWFLERRVRA